MSEPRSNDNLPAPKQEPPAANSLGEDVLAGIPRRSLSPNSSPAPAERTPANDIYANIPKRGQTSSPEEDANANSAPVGLKKKDKKDVLPAGKRSRWENTLRALWTTTSVISMVVNIVVIALLVGLYQNYTILNIPPEISIDTPKDLLQGLYDNFQLMDQAHITRVIPVNGSIPVQFPLEIKQETTVVLSDAVVIEGARVDLFTGGLNINNAPATVTLPAGTSLPIILNLLVEVDQNVPIKELPVTVDIPLNETELHTPFTGLQDVVRPLYCLVASNAVDANGVAVCPPKVTE